MSAWTRVHWTTTAIRAVGLVLVHLALISLSTALPARAAWPERPISLIVCFPPGGGSDVVARSVNVPLGEALGQPVVVENRAGAGGNIGIGAAARAKPDGYTFLLCSSAYVVNPSIYSKVPYDPLKDFVPVMNFGDSPNVITVRAQSPIKSLPDLIARAREAPGKLNYTTPGVGTTPHIAGETLKLRAGLDVVHITYSGAGPAVQAGLTGTVDYLVTSLSSVAGQIGDGALRAIAQTGAQRWPDLAEVPTLAELGIADAQSSTFQALFAPAGTPQPAIDRVVKELTAIMQRPAVREAFRKMGSTTLAEGPELFRARIERELVMYRAIVQEAKLQVN